MFPHRFNRIDNSPAKSPGKTPTIAVKQNKRKYARAGGNPAYVIGANVSHQHVPKKKTVPNIQPSTNDFTADSFSRFTAQSKGTSAIHARNQNSKSGNDRISKIAAASGATAFFQSGNIDRTRANFIATVYQTRVRSARKLTLKHFLPT